MLILGDKEHIVQEITIPWLSCCVFLPFKYSISPPTTRFQGRPALPHLRAFDPCFPYFWGYFSSLCFVNYESPIFNLQIVQWGPWHSTSQNCVPTKLDAMFSVPQRDDILEGREHVLLNSENFLPRSPSHFLSMKWTNHVWKEPVVKSTTLNSQTIIPLTRLHTY